MDLSPEEESKIPLLDKFFSPELKKRIRSSGPCVVTAAFIAFHTVAFGTLAWCIIAAGIANVIQPEIQLNSLFVCPKSRESVIWDLKLDIINTHDDSELCIGGRFEVSIFPYNQTKLLTMAVVRPSTCIGPRNHTSVIGLVEASSSIQDLNDYLDPTTGTIRLDLKIDRDGYELVCGDAKVALSSNPSSSCGSMVGDPFACAYEPHSGTTGLSFSDFLVLFVLVAVLGLLIVGHLHLLRLRQRVQS